MPDDPQSAYPQAAHARAAGARHVRIAPSILAADFARLGEEVAAIAAAGADWIHVDVMDGRFVPSLSFGPAVVRSVRPYTDLPFDVHLMVEPVDPLIPAIVEAGADRISFHPESGPHPHRTARLIRSLGRKVGLAVNPGTPVAVVEPLIDEIDLVLAMTVDPGFGGQRFLDGQIGKIARLRALIDEAGARTGRTIDLEVDGGVDAGTGRRAVAAGADVLVAGTAVFAGGPPAYAANIRRLRDGA